MLKQRSKHTHTHIHKSSKVSSRCSLTSRYTAFFHLSSTLVWCTIVALFVARNTKKIWPRSCRVHCVPSWFIESISLYPYFTVEPRGIYSEGEPRERKNERQCRVHTCSWHFLLLAPASLLYLSVRFYTFTGSIDTRTVYLDNEKIYLRTYYTLCGCTLQQECYAGRRRCVCISSICEIG